MSELRTELSAMANDSLDWLQGHSVGGCLVRGTLLTAALFASTCYIANRQAPYDHGTKTGTVTRIERTSWSWQTYEGVLALEGSTSDRGAERWRFSLDAKAEDFERESLARLLETYQRDKTKVTVTYDEQHVRWWPRGRTPKYVTRVEPVVQK